MLISSPLYQIRHSLDSFLLSSKRFLCFVLRVPTSFNSSYDWPTPVDHLCVCLSSNILGRRASPSQTKQLRHVSSFCMPDFLFISVVFRASYIVNFHFLESFCRARNLFWTVIQNKFVYIRLFINKKNIHMIWWINIFTTS
jgi:hypothetical protein